MKRFAIATFVASFVAFGCAGNEQKEPEYPQTAAAPAVPASEQPVVSASGAESAASATDQSGSVEVGATGRGEYEGTFSGGEQPSQVTGVMCPMTIQGAEVTTARLADGVRLEFKAPRQELAELRSRVHYLANIYNGPVGLFENQSAANVKYSAVSADTTEGASITMRTQDQQGVDQLRAEVQKHATAMSNSRICPMLTDRAQ